MKRPREQPSLVGYHASARVSSSGGEHRPTSQTPASRKSNQKPQPKGPKQGKKTLVRKAQPKIAQRPQALLQSNTPKALKNSAGGIPIGKTLRGLKMPSQGDSEHIQNRLKKKSPWYTSICDPLHGADCKIPDATGVETGTLQLVLRVPLAANANGVTGVRVVSPFAFTGPGYNAQKVHSSSAVSTITWDTTTTLTFESNTVLEAYAQAHRVVSAAVYVQSEASLSENSGLFTGYTIPYPSASVPNGLALDTYQNRYKSALIPINNNKPCEVRWYPIDAGEQVYSMFHHINPNVPRWEMGVIISGAPPDASFIANIVVNYEFLPLYNALNILDASPSPVDAMETDLVENWVQTMEPVVITSTSKVASSPSTVSPAHEDDQTGFGMFFHVLTELAPMALALL